VPIVGSQGHLRVSYWLVGQIGRSDGATSNRLVILKRPTQGLRQRRPAKMEL